MREFLRSEESALGPLNSVQLEFLDSYLRFGESTEAMTPDTFLQSVDVGPLTPGWAEVWGQSAVHGADADFACTWFRKRFVQQTFGPRASSLSATLKRQLSQGTSKVSKRMLEEALVENLVLFGDSHDTVQDLVEAARERNPRSLKKIAKEFDLDHIFTPPF